MVLTQKNRGPSAARNKGLDQASGTYIAFADADDVCEARWLEKMLDAVKGKNCELAMCSWVKVNSEGEEMTDDFPRTLDLVDPVQFIPLLKGLGGAVWNKLFRRDIIERENIRFDPSKLRSEDFAFVLEYLVHVKRIALVSERLYRYRMMEQSLSHISDKGRLYLEICAGQYDALDQIRQKADPRLYGELVQYVVDTNINGLIYVIRHKADAFYKNQLKLLLKAHTHWMNQKQKHYYRVIRISPELFEFVWSLLFEIKRKRRHAS